MELGIDESSCELISHVYEHATEKLFFIFRIAKTLEAAMLVRNIYSYLKLSRASS